jgi:cytochrome c oxidase subunit II
MGGEGSFLSNSRRPRLAPRRPGLAHMLRVGAFLVPLLILSGCVPAGISAKSSDVHRLFYIILWLALPVFVFVEGMLLYSIIRYRKRRGDESSPPQIPGNNRALAAFFAGPLAVIIALLVVGEVAEAKVDRNDRHPTERVVVNGFQWAWSANYVNESFTVTGKTLKKPLTMELPVGKPTRIQLRSNDVIHEFYVPHVLYMKNAIPGHPNTITITPRKVGTYAGRCAQFCGLWHSQMTFVVKVVPVAEFHAWVDQQKNAGPGGAGGACQPMGSSLALAARQISWDKSCLAAVARKPFQITIKNEDNGIAHNFAIWDSPAMKHQLYISSDLTGPATRTFTVPPLPPGKYYFQCDIHGPAMAGSLIVK